MVPKEYADEIEEPAAQTMLRQLQSVEISLPDYSVHSTFVGPVEASPKQEGTDLRPTSICKREQSKFARSRRCTLSLF